MCHFLIARTERKWPIKRPFFFILSLSFSSERKYLITKRKERRRERRGHPTFPRPLLSSSNKSSSSGGRCQLFQVKPHQIQLVILIIFENKSFILGIFLRLWAGQKWMVELKFRKLLGWNIGIEWTMAIDGDRPCGFEATSRAPFFLWGFQVRSIEYSFAIGVKVDISDIICPCMVIF